MTWFPRVRSWRCRLDSPRSLAAAVARAEPAHSDIGLTPLALPNETSKCAANEVTRRVLLSVVSSSVPKDPSQQLWRREAPRRPRKGLTVGVPPGDFAGGQRWRTEGNPEPISSQLESEAVGMLVSIFRRIDHPQDGLPSSFTEVDRTGDASRRPEGDERVLRCIRRESRRGGRARRCARYVTGFSTWMA